MKEIRQLLNVPIESVLRHFRIKVPDWGDKGLVFCPFHEETRPSFLVNKDKNFCYCFGCVKSWDSIQLIRDKKKCSFFEALKVLAEIGGLSLSERSLREIYTNFKSAWGRAREGQENIFYEKFVGMVKDEFTRFYQSLSTWKNLNHIIDYCWTDLDVILVGKLSRRKIDQCKDWFHHAVKAVKKAHNQWKKLPVLKDEAWRERVEV